MKRLVVGLIICILCIPAFSVILPKAEALVETGVYTNPVPPGYGFINFEEGTDGQVIRSTWSGLLFTTTLGYDWVYGDVRTGSYYARSLTDPSVNYGDYVLNGYFFAWLGPNMGEGRIDFVNGPATYLSVLTSTYSGLVLDAYDSADNLIASSGWAGGNLGTYTFTRLTVQAPNMAYVLIHDTGNYWLIDDLVTDAGGQWGLGPGPVFTCIHVSADPVSISEIPGQSSTITATVSDQLGNPMSGVSVAFTSSLGTLSSSTAQTDNQGKATVALSPDSSTMDPVVATVSVESNGVSASTDVTFSPPTSPATKWTDCSAFKVQSLTMKFSNYLQPWAKAYNLWNLFNPSVQISITNLNNLPPAIIYLVTMASSASQDEFSQAIFQFFGISSPTDDYDPAGVLIFEVPVLQTINVLFNAAFEGPIRINLPDNLKGLLDNPYLETTTEGYFNIALTYHKLTSLGSVAFESLMTLADSVESLIKAAATGKVSGLIQDAIDLVKERIELWGDLTLDIITSDLDQTGSLASYVFFDLLHFIDAITTFTGLALKFVDVTVTSTVSLSTFLTDIGADVSTLMTSLDIGLEVLPLIPGASGLSDNPMYQALETGVSIIDTRLDPEHTTIIPSFYDSTGSLMLGYNSTSNDIIYASPNGNLIPVAGDWIALLSKNATDPADYTIHLNAVGGNASVPYNLQIIGSNQNATAIGYSGMVIGGTSCEIPVEVAANGTLIQEIYLEPTLSVTNHENDFDFFATGMLSNGSLTFVSRAYVIINGSQYEMARVNASTFETHLDLYFRGSVQFSVYMISPDNSGGFATGVLRNVIALTDVAPAKTVIGQGFMAGINVTVENYGCYSETFAVTTYADATPIGSQNVTISPGNSAVVHFIWNTAGFDYSNYTVTAFAVPIQGETYTDDNLFIYGVVKVRIPGDINGDFTVDIYDAILLSNAFNTYPGHPNWNANADINGDNIVDIYDAIILAGHFNQHYP